MKGNEIMSKEEQEIELDERIIYQPSVEVLRLAAKLKKATRCSDKVLDQIAPIRTCQAVHRTPIPISAYWWLV